MASRARVRRAELRGDFDCGLPASERSESMSSLNIRKDPCELDFLSLGALVHRLDPGVIPFRKARSFEIHVSGGEYNVAANLSDCFGLQTGIATAMVNYPIGELVQARVRETGVDAVLQVVRARRRPRAEHRHGLQRPRLRRPPAGRLLQPRRTRPAPCSSRAISTGRGSSAAACAGSTPAASSPRCPRRRPR